MNNNVYNIVYTHFVVVLLYYVDLPLLLFINMLLRYFGYYSHNDGFKHRCEFLYYK